MKRCENTTYKWWKIGREKSTTIKETRTGKISRVTRTTSSWTTQPAERCSRNKKQIFLLPNSKLLTKTHSKNSTLRLTPTRTARTRDRVRISGESSTICRCLRLIRSKLLRTHARGSTTRIGSDSSRRLNSVWSQTCKEHWWPRTRPSMNSHKRARAWRKSCSPA